MSKIKDLKEQHPEFNIDIIQMLSKRDPSGVNKYLPYMISISKDFVKQYLADGSFLDTSMIQLFQLVNEFHDLCERKLIEKKDIYVYPDAKSIQDVVELAKEKETRSQVKKKETIILYENKDCLLIKPLTLSASNIYGKNTQWCTSADTNNRFVEYAESGTLLYFIWKNPPEDLNENWRKMAINKKNDEDNGTVWDALDKEISAMNLIRAFHPTGNEDKERGNKIFDIINEEYTYNIPNLSLTKKEDGTVICSDEAKEHIREINPSLDVDKYIKDHYN